MNCWNRVGRMLGDVVLVAGLAFIAWGWDSPGPMAPVPEHASAWVEAAGREPCIWAHMTVCYEVPLFSFCRYLSNVEFTTGVEFPGPRDAMDMWSPDTLRILGGSAKWGTGYHNLSTLPRALPNTAAARQWAYPQQRTETGLYLASDQMGAGGRPRAGAGQRRNLRRPGACLSLVASGRGRDRWRRPTAPWRQVVGAGILRFFPLLADRQRDGIGHVLSRMIRRGRTTRTRVPWSSAVPATRAATISIISRAYWSWH